MYCGYRKSSFNQVVKSPDTIEDLCSFHIQYFYLPLLFPGPYVLSHTRVSFPSRSPESTATQGVITI